MIHCHAIQANPALEPSDCRGDLVPIGSYPDWQVIDAKRVESTVEIHRCAGCGQLISMRGADCLNAYRPLDLARNLARDLDAGPHLPPAPEVDPR